MGRTGLIQHINRREEDLNLAAALRVANEAVYAAARIARLTGSPFAADLKAMALKTDAMVNAQ